MTDYKETNGFTKQIFNIIGGRPLTGTLECDGSKNSAIAIIPALLAIPCKVVLNNIPNVIDVWVICDILRNLGAKIEYNPKQHQIEYDGSQISSTRAVYDLVRRMRASFLVMGPLLGRFGHAEVAMPGGCRIGQRPVDKHLYGFEKLGAKIEIVHGEVKAICQKLKGTEIQFDIPSVGATENIIIAAALADGETTIINAAREPEVVDLANFLNACGAQIAGQGTETIQITGVSELHGVEYDIIPDRVVAGTYIIAAAATRGNVKFKGINFKHIKSLMNILERIKVDFTTNESKNELTINAGNAPLASQITSQEYPGFPTDLQPQMMAYLTSASGVSVITENIFEDRFTHIPELRRMGAVIDVRKNTAIVEGNPQKRLTGADVSAFDIRGGAAMIIAGLMAEGETRISGIDFIDRGYESIESKLTELGASIVRI